MKLTAQKSYIVAKYILKNRTINQRKIAGDTNTALGYVNEIIQYLREVNVISRKNINGETIDPFRLLQIMSYERPLGPLEIYLTRLPTTEVIESEFLIKRVCERNNIKYALTGFSGLRRYYEYHLSYPIIHCYISDGDIIDKIEQGNGPIVAKFLKSDHKNILKDSVIIDEYKICDNIQVLIDLFSSGIGMDAAYKYINVIYNE